METAPSKTVVKKHVPNEQETIKKLSKAQLTWRRMIKHWQFYVLIIPPLLYIIIFKYLPLAGMQIAFREFNVVGGIWGSPWVGMENFNRFFHSPEFWKTLGNTLEISSVTLIFTFPAPIILALLLNEVRVGIFKKFTQTITFAPHFISVVVMAGMIILFLDPSVGLIARIFQVFGLHPINFLASATDFKFVYALSEVWQHTGYSSIIYLAALAGVNPELYEAAKVDGASKLQKIIHIDIPGIMPAITILLILSIGELTSVGFEKILLLQNPVNLPGSQVIPTYVYQMGLINADYSYATAIGIFNSLINFILLFVVNTLSRRISEHSLW